jgi:hypothetical protein
MSRPFSKKQSPGPWEPKRDQPNPKAQKQQEQQQQQERTSPHDARDETSSIFHASPDESKREREEREEGHGSCSSSVSYLSSSSSVNSLRALPDEEGEDEDKEEEEEKEELATLQKTMKQSLDNDLERHLAEVQEEREVAVRTLREERRQQLLQIKELEEGDTDMLSSLSRGLRDLYTLLFDLICTLTEDLFQVCLPALLAFCFSLLHLLKRGAWREVGPLVSQKLGRLSSHLTVIPSDVAHFTSDFPFLPSMALMGMSLLLGCGVWYWRLEMEYAYGGGEEGAATAAAVAAAAVSTTVEEVGGALVEVASHVKDLMSG